MSYPTIPRDASEHAGSPAAEDAIRALLTDLAGRKEFCAFRSHGPAPSGQGAAAAAIPGFGAPGPASERVRLFLPGLRLHGAQLFIRNFENPDTEFTRLLIEWQTGTGKSIAAASIGHEFIRQYRARAGLGERAPTVFVISFTARETIQEDMLRFPEFGFVSQSEVEELRRLRAAAGAMGPASPEARQLSGFVGVLRRRITDRARGGYYQFYGYKEFANRLFVVTRQGLARGFDVQALYSRAEGAFGERLAEAVRRGDVLVNEDLLDELRGGLLIADEIHNVYNILEKNNYGIAIQYALDALGDEAPRAVFMSATPMTGSAAEVVDLLNLLVPRAALPGGAPLRRADFFIRTTAAEEAAEAAADEEAEEDEEAAGEGGTAFVVSQLREGALERIGHLAAGRVSFLLDSDVGSYPRRIFVGDEVAGVPYLRLTPCPMAPFHAQTLAREQVGKSETAGLAANAYTLYDMAFPNPEFAPDAALVDDPEAYGLYRSGETPTKLTQASEEWRAAAGVIVEKGAEAGVSSGTYVISGAFLGPGRLPHYSAKFDGIVAAAIEAVRAGPGKIMIYHHRVRMSGVLLIQEALRMNGFADESSAPTDATLCGVCGVPRGEHPAEGHAYTPARFVVAHSDVDRAVMVRSIARFNAATNLEGYQFRIILGSKIVREALNFRAVRHQLIGSLPTDYPTLIQVFGRVVRKDSHSELPEDQRDVRIRVFVSTRADGRPSPELQRYIDKGREFLVIQEVERALRIYAVDGFANYFRIRTALHSGPGGELRPSLDSLPYSPLVGPDAAPAAPRTATFEAYGHGEREVATIAAVCRVLFRARPVWTYEDLWAAVRLGAVRGVNYDPGLFDEGNYALALESLGRPAGDPPSVVVRAGRFYLAARAGPDGKPALDVESYLRESPFRGRPSPPPAKPEQRKTPHLRVEWGPQPVTVKVADYLREARSGQNFAVRLRAYEDEYLRPGAPSTPELSLVEYGASFHYALLRRLVAAGPGERVTSDDARVSNLYRRFRVAVTVADAGAPAAARVFRGARGKSPEALVGYVTPDAVALYDPDTTSWYSASHTDFAVGRRHRENDIVVGFVVSVGEAPRAEAPGDAFAAFAAASAEARFKIRPPVQKLRAAAASATPGKKADARSLARGAVCETRPREELQAYAKRLRDAVARVGAEPLATRAGGSGCHGGCYGDSGRRMYDEALVFAGASWEGGFSAELQAQLDYAAKFDRAAQKRFPSANEMCDALRLHLLALEEHARAPVNGMTDGLRWLYLFNDRPPTISALTSQK